MNNKLQNNSCSNCAFYMFNKEYADRYCRRPDIDCHAGDLYDNWKNNEFFPTNSLYFLTIACCAYKELPDDCELLNTIRRFRDEWLINQSYDVGTIKIRYFKTLEIIDKINSLESEERDKCYEMIYKELLEIKQLIDFGRNDDAEHYYQKLYIFLKFMNDSDYHAYEVSAEDVPYIPNLFPEKTD